jgi:Domain of unknown function (DUF4878)
MKKIILLLLVIAAAAGCKESGYKKADDAQDAARKFIEASLGGDYDKARFYLYNDSAGVNEMLLNKWRSDYDKWTQENKVGHKESNIIVINTEKINDSTLNYIYSNTYKKDTTTIKIIKANGDWLVDLKDIH